MNETNLYAPPEAPLKAEPRAPRTGPPESIGQAALLGVITGFKWTCYLVLPLIVLFMVGGVGSMLLDAEHRVPGASLSWSIFSYLLLYAVAAVLLCAYGMAAGGVVGTLCYGVRNAWEGLGRSRRRHDCSADRLGCRIENELTSRSPEG